MYLILQQHGLLSHFPCTNPAGINNIPKPSGNCLKSHLATNLEITFVAIIKSKITAQRSWLESTFDSPILIK